MVEIRGKVLVFTDLHFGIHSNSPSYIKICEDTMGWIKCYCKQHNIKNVIFLGDFFDSRASIDVKTLNVATKSLYELSEEAQVIMVLGNHDIYMRDSTSIHSLKAFNGNKNITVLDTPEFGKLNGNDIVFLPWMYGTSKQYIKEYPSTLQYVFAHHNFPTTFFFKTKKKRSDSFVSKKIYEDEYDIQNDLIKTIIQNNGIFFSGHLHHREEIPIGNGKSKIIINGSPYETEWGFNDVDCGIYVIDEECAIEFTANPYNKKHKEIRTSKMESDLLNVDFANSIVRINVDSRESFDTISKLQHTINSNNPFSCENTKYEFSVAEFVGKRNEDENPLDTITHKVASKLDYILKAIEDNDFLSHRYLKNGKECSVDKERIKELAREIYMKVK